MDTDKLGYSEITIGQTAASFLDDIHPDLIRDKDGVVSEERIEHFLVLLKAWEIYAERDKLYGDGWRERGWKGNVCDILRKSKRIRAMFWEDRWSPSSSAGYGPEVDDALDLINYSVFFIRNLRDGRKWG